MEVKGLVCSLRQKGVNLPEILLCCGLAAAKTIHKLPASSKWP